MAVAGAWTVGTTVNLLTTELNSLATTTGVISSVGGSSGVFNNIVGGTSNLVGAPLCRLQLVLAAPAAAWTAGGAFKLWLVQSLDGTNFEDYSTSGGVYRFPLATFYPLPNASAQRLFADFDTGNGVRAPQGELTAGYWKVFLMNLGGQAMAASGNTVSVQAVYP